MRKFPDIEGSSGVIFPRLGKLSALIFDAVRVGGVAAGYPVLRRLFLWHSLRPLRE